MVVVKGKGGKEGRKDGRGWRGEGMEVEFEVDVSEGG